MSRVSSSGATSRRHGFDRRKRDRSGRGVFRAGQWHRHPSAIGQNFTWNGSATALFTLGGANAASQLAVAGRPRSAKPSGDVQFHSPGHRQPRQPTLATFASTTFLAGDFSCQLNLAAGLLGTFSLAGKSIVLTVSCRQRRSRHYRPSRDVANGGEREARSPSSATVSGSPAPTYQWYLNGDKPVPGATSAPFWWWAMRARPMPAAIL